MAAVSSIVAGAGALAGVAGSAMGAKEAGKGRKAAERAQRQALAQFSGLDIPSVEDQRLNLEELQQVGTFTPELQEALELGPSAMEEISTDPRLASAQMAALEQLGEVAEGGLSAGDRASIEEARRGAEAASQAQQAAVLQDMQQRGQGGSGAELIARLQAAQSSADRAGAAGLDVAQASQARALQALGDEANLAAQIRSQSFGEQSDVARAKDLIDRFNLENQQGIEGANISALNQAQLANLAEQQRIADANAALRNQQQQSNKALLQQDYQNRMGLAQAKAGQQAQLGNVIQQGANQQAAMMAGAGSALGSGLMGLAGTLGKSSAPAAAKPQAQNVAMNTTGGLKFGNMA